MINSAIASDSLRVSDVADINGDGIPDLIMYGSQGAGWGYAYIYVLFGTQSGFSDPTTVSTAALNGKNGFIISVWQADFLRATADFNGDGYKDFIFCNHGHGTCYIIFGGPTKKDGTAWAALQTADSLINGVNGIEILATSPSIPSAFSYGTVGDFNGDGYADLIVSAYTQTPASNGVTAAGEIFVVYGGPTKKDGTAWATTQQLGALVNGTNGIELDGINASSWWGAPLAMGDINGDGYQDMIIGEPSAHFTHSGVASQYGAVDVIFGGPTMKDGTAWPSTGTGVPIAASGIGGAINGTNGFELQGPGANGSLGYSVAAGDINGDGYADMLIGNASGTSVPTSLVFGGSLGPNGGNFLWSSTPIVLKPTTVLNGTNGFGITVPNQGGVNTQVSMGDVSCDGYADMIVGDFGTNSNAGSLWIIFGGKSGPQGGGSWATSYALPNSTFLNGVNGFELDGAAANNEVRNSRTGDINGDGCADLITSAPYASPGGVSDAGSVYVFFGKHFGFPTSAYNVGGL